MTAVAPTKEIALDDALPGMILANAILDKSGALLMSQGVHLTDKSIAALKQRGIPQINVMQPVTDEARHQFLEQAFQRLDVLFQSSHHSEPNRFLLDCLRRYRAKETS